MGGGLLCVFLGGLFRELTGNQFFYTAASFGTVLISFAALPLAVRAAIRKSYRHFQFAIVSRITELN